MSVDTGSVPTSAGVPAGASPDESTELQMTDMITLTGFVATVPRHFVSKDGVAITSFRLASTQRRYDRAKAAWVDGDTNWYTITGFRQLAINAAGSVYKGDRVIVTGKVRIREWENEAKQGTTIDIEAEGIGHDLSWGTTSFTRSVSSSLSGGSGSGSPVADGSPDAAVAALDEATPAGAGADDPGERGALAQSDAESDSIATPF